MSFFSERFASPLRRKIRCVDRYRDRGLSNLEFVSPSGLVEKTISKKNKKNTLRKKNQDGAMNSNVTHGQ